MDGLKGVVPDSCGEKPKPDAQGAMFFEPLSVPCEGCRTGDIRSHNGTYCLIKDWGDDYPQPRKREKKIR